MIVLMDAGGVLFNNPIEESVFLDEIAARAGVPRPQLARGYEARDREFETDARDVHAILRQVLRELGAPHDLVSDVAWVDALYLANVVAHLEAFSLVRELRQSGHVVVLSNNEARHWDELKNREFGHFQLFDQLASSWVVRQVKPEPAYFEAVRLTCSAERSPCLLIDDNPEVVLAARSIGITTLQYSNERQARTDLRELGLLPS